MRVTTASSARSHTRLLGYAIAHPNVFSARGLDTTLGRSSAPCEATLFHHVFPELLRLRPRLLLRML
jgi:hypothetical protein